MDHARLKRAYQDCVAQHGKRHADRILSLALCETVDQVAEFADVWDQSPALIRLFGNKRAADAELKRVGM